MGESVGLLSEQKVLCMGMQDTIDAERVTLSLAADLPNGHDRREGSNGDRIETHEKRTRFSLSHDEGKFYFLALSVLRFQGCRWIVKHFLFNVK